MTVPNWYTLALLSLAAYRTFRLLSEDTILDRLRARVLGYRGWQEGQKLPSSYRVKLSEFVGCPACLGAWVSLFWWVAWEWQTHITTVAAVPLAVSVIVIAVSSFIDKQ